MQYWKNDAINIVLRKYGNLGVAHRSNKTGTSKVGAISKAQKAQKIFFGKKIEIFEKIFLSKKVA